MTENLKINRPAEGGEPMTKVLRDGEGFDLSALRAAPPLSAAPKPGEEDPSEAEKAEWGCADDRGLYGERS